MDLHVQVSFTTRDTRYSVPSHPISLPRSSTVDDLRDVLQELLERTVDSVSFDFLLDNEFIEGTLDEFLLKKKISSESIEVEFTVRQEAPEAVSKITHEDYISCIKRRGDFILTGSYANTVKLHTVTNTDPIFTLSLEEEVKAVEWIHKSPNPSEDSVFITGGFQDHIRLWVWNMAKLSVSCVATCKGHKNTVTALASTSSIPNCSANLFASGSFDSTIKVWSADVKDTDLSVETGGIPHIRKSADKIPVRIPRLTLAGHRNIVSALSWYVAEGGAVNQPKLVSCSWDQSLRLWDVDASGGGSSAGAGGDSVAPKCGEARCVVVGSALNDLSVAPQGILVAATDNKVRVYDLRAKDALAQIGYQGHRSCLTACAWAPHRGDQFVTGSVDREVKLWDTRRLSAPLYDLIGHTDMVTAVDWAPPNDKGEHFIASASADGTAKIYHYPA